MKNFKEVYEILQFANEHIVEMNAKAEKAVKTDTIAADLDAKQRAAARMPGHCYLRHPGVECPEKEKPCRVVIFTADQYIARFQTTAQKRELIELQEMNEIVIYGWKEPIKDYKLATAVNKLYFNEHTLLNVKGNYSSLLPCLPGVSHDSNSQTSLVATAKQTPPEAKGKGKTTEQPASDNGGLHVTMSVRELVEKVIHRSETDMLNALSSPGDWGGFRSVVPGLK